MSRVCIERRAVFKYPNKGTFRPHIDYPEYPFNECSNEENEIYDMVRACFIRMGYDTENVNTSEWNPLKNVIKPGQNVLIKPNLVMDKNPSGDGVECLYTNPSVVAAVLDYVYIALKGHGNIVVGDAPMQECNFEKLVTESGYQALINWCNQHYRGVKIDLVDFRDVSSCNVGGVYRYKFAKKTKGRIIDLADDSEFAGLDEYSKRNIRITNYDPDILKQHHNGDKNEYYINDNVLQADVIINIPKPKTHRKAGVTISLKNMVGINARKEFLPHHTNGAICEGGDEYLHPSVMKRLMDKFLDKRNYAAETKNCVYEAHAWNFLTRVLSVFNLIFRKDAFFEGSWYGNQTISRTIYDLNKIIFYADKNGIMQTDKQRTYLIVADMIVAGEKEGPVVPSAKKVGMIAAGENPVEFDRVIATIMGADISRIPTLSQFNYTNSRYTVATGDDTVIVSNDSMLDQKKTGDISKESILYFEPTSGWRNVFLKR